ERAGWTSGRTLGLAAVAAVLLAAFVRRQARVATPLMPLRLFRSRNGTGANVVQALLVVGMFGMFFLGALYLQQVLGYDALQVGLAFLPTTVVMGAMSLRLSHPITARFGAMPSLILALVALAAGLVLFARTPVDGVYLTDVLPPMVLIGFGAGLGFPALVGLAMSGARPEDSGLASGLVNTSVQVGGAIGLAVLATLAGERTAGRLDAGDAAAAALNSGFHLAYLIGAVLVGVAIVIALAVLRPAPAPDAQAPAAPAEQRRRRPAYADAA